MSAPRLQGQKAQMTLMNGGRAMPGEATRHVDLGQVGPLEVGHVEGTMSH